MEHAGFCSSAVLHDEAGGLNSAKRVLNFASLAFDASLIEILSSLILGKTVCVPSEGERVNDLAGAIQRTGAEFAVLTPSVLRALVPASLAGLKTVLSGGEPMDARLISSWEPHVRIIQGYGPTEAGVMCCSNLAPRVQEPTNLGTCFSGHAWVVRADDTSRLVPLGAVGELLLDSPTLARGYLNDPDRTAAAFISHPRWDKDHGQQLQSTGDSQPSGRPRRLYRTGDLVRQRPDDGTFVYLGRIDSQIKVRGQRCETAEIERQVLLQNPNLSYAAVQLSPSGRLVAVVANEATSDTTKDKNDLDDDDSVPLLADRVKAVALSARVVESLVGRVPDFMIPTWVLAVERMPLTVGGKINRGVLRYWVESLSDDQMRVAHGEPGATAADGADHEDADDDNNNEDNNSSLLSPAETSLRAIWAGVLGRRPDQIPTAQSFISLGGDSITAMQVITRCRDAGITSLNVQHVFQAASIHELASRVGYRPEAANDGGPGVEDGEGEEEDDEDGPCELSLVQRWYFAKSPTGVHRFHQGSDLRLKRRVEPAVLAKAIDSVVARHPMLRSRFTRGPDNGRWSQYWTECRSQTGYLKAHTVSSLDDIVPLLAAAELTLDVRHGPVFAAHLVEGPDDAQYLFLMAHHLVVDQVSLRIIQQDLEDYITGDGQLPPSPPTYGSWLRAQQRRAAASPSTTHPTTLDMGPGAAFWGLSDAENTFGLAETHSFELSPEATRALLAASDYGCRAYPQELMAAAAVYSFTDVFHDRSGPRLFVENHGRHGNSPAAHGTVGWFTAVQSVDVAPESATDVWELLRLVKDALRTHRGSADGPRDALLDIFSDSDDAGDASRPSTFELLFNYVGQFQQLEGDDNLFGAIEEPALAKRLHDEPSVRLSPDMPRFAVLDLTLLVQARRLQVTLTFPSRTRHRERILAWANRYEAMLAKLPRELPRQPLSLTLSDLGAFDLAPPSVASVLARRLPASLSTNAVEALYRCSPMQRGMLLAQLRSPKIYQANMTFEIAPARIHRVADAWRRVVARHAILRTVILDDVLPGGEPCQVVLRNADPAIRIQPEGQKDVQADDDHEPFEPHSPPHRLIITPLPGDRVRWRLEISHVLVDAHSTGLILREVASAYDGDMPHGLPTPSFGDFASYLQNCNEAEALAFWRRRLQGAEPCYLSQDVTRGGPTSGHDRDQQDVAQEHDARFVERRLDVTALSKACQSWGISMASAVQTAWGLVLARFTARDDVCFGYAGAGRDIPELGSLDHVLGPFISLLVTRVPLHADVPGPGPRSATAPPRLRDALRRVQDEYFEALPHQHGVSLGDLHHALRLHGRRLFDTGLSFAIGSEAHGQSHDATTIYRHGSLGFKELKARQNTDYAVGVNAVATGSRLDLRLTYRPDLVSDSVAVSVGDTLVQALTLLSRASDADTLVGLLDTLPVPSRRLPDREAALERTVSPIASATTPATGSFTPAPLATLAPAPTPHLAPTPHTSHVPSPPPAAANATAPNTTTTTTTTTATNGTTTTTTVTHTTGAATTVTTTTSTSNATAALPSYIPTAPRSTATSPAPITPSIFPPTPGAANSAPASVPTSISHPTPASTGPLLRSASPSAPTAPSSPLHTTRRVSITPPSPTGPPPTLSPDERHTETESTLRRLWAGVLRVDPTTIRSQDDFFELGADSIFVMRLCSAARKAHIPLSGPDVFQHPVLADLAAYIDSQALGPGDRPGTEAYQPPSVLDSGLLLRATAAQTGITEGDIEAVVEATDTQADLAIASMGSPRFQVIFFTFDFRGASFDPTRLVTACELLVRRYAILRTTFFASHSRIYHAVQSADSARLDWTRDDQCTDLDAAAKAWTSASSSRQMSLPGQPLARFCLLQPAATQGADSTAARLIIELSHAQYDAVSYNLLVNALRDAYTGRQTGPAPPQMHHYLRWVADQNEKEAHAVAFWRRLLDGANVRHLVPPPPGPPSPPRAPRPLGGAIRRILDLPAAALPQSPSVSFAVVLKAAWAVVLSHATGSRDIVFSQTVAGRNMPFPGLEQVVGACINVTPVRVRLDDADNSTWRALLKQIHDQHIASLPHESLGTRRLIQRCTEWAPGTRLSTVVNHLGAAAPDSYHESKASVDLAFDRDISCRLGYDGLPPDDQQLDIAIASAPVQGNPSRMSIGIAFAEHLVTHALATELLDQLCNYIKACLGQPDSCALAPAAPGPRGRSSSLLEPCTPPGPLLGNKYYPLVRQAWADTLGDAYLAVAQPVTGWTVQSYRGLWPHPFASVELVRHYARQGVAVTIDDIVRCPTMAQQTELLARQAV